MGKNELTKAEARKLITPVVDNEVSEEERQAFMDFIAKHDDVRREYESIKKIKSLIGSRCPCERAPSSLLEYVKSMGQQDSSLQELKIPIYDISCEKSVGQCYPYESTSEKSSSYPWIFSLAATLLIAAAFWGFFNFYGVSSNAPVYNIEEYAYAHFQKYNGQFVPPTISTASLGSAEIQMAQNYDIRMTIPALENAEFKGVIYTDFVPDFKAPMLEYYLPAENQYIYIFAFKLDDIKNFGRLARDQEAIKKCNKPKDFYVHNVNGKHVVSWKWDNVWYAAISNHHGDTLASLVKPLQYAPSEN